MRSSAAPHRQARTASGLLLSIAFALAAAIPVQAAGPDVILVTLDTTRSDALGCYGNRPSLTPVIDSLAARGVRFAHAITAAPLTLPAHTALLTGLEPLETGIHENGTTSLPRGIPTLATLFRARGYATAAFVSSRVLDRRFGLDNGFDVYDDHMLAERIGEDGYPERDAAAVTTAALAWLQKRTGPAPFFLWVHYYDPHAPYAAPGDLHPSGSRDAYLAEVAYVDRQLGRLLGTVDRRKTVLAIAGDHGEALGDHGERTHGLLLQRSTLEVPFIIVAPTITPAVNDVPVGTVRLPATLLRLAGVTVPPAMAPPLPMTAQGDGAMPIYSETFLPTVAYGWSELRALTKGDWRFVSAPRPELYEWRTDPEETRNRVDSDRRVAAALRAELLSTEAKKTQRHRAASVSDPALSEALRSLGYLSSTSRRTSSVDPKDGLALLARYEAARNLLSLGRARDAVGVLEPLVQQSPGNVPFLTALADARMRAGDGNGAIAALRLAVSANPQLDLLHLNLADALREAGRSSEARREYELALRLNRRLAAAWLRLSELDESTGRKAARERLEAAIAAGADSVAVFSRLARLQFESGQIDQAERSLRGAFALTQEWPAAWIIAGEIAERRGNAPEAERDYSTAVRLQPTTDAYLHLGRLFHRQRRAEATSILQRVIDLAPRSRDAAEARKLLADR